MAKIIIVNDKDNIIGCKEREALVQKDIYRVAALWIIKNNGEILLARRAYSKEKDPGMWGPAVAGTVEEGETYESNIVKEAKEELGLTNIDKLNKGKKRRVKTPHNHFTQWFVLRLESESTFETDKEEVAEIKWFTKEELIELIKHHPKEVVNSMKDYLNFLP
jgi:isopentenyldiphosphate isomerase